jgi:hypothetical protein
VQDGNVVAIKKIRLGLAKEVTFSYVGSKGDPERHSRKEKESESDLVAQT